LPLTPLTPPVPANTTLQLRAIFDEFDDDGGGTIDTAELGLVMVKLGQNCTEAELMGLANEVDPSGSGEITFEQFQGMMEGADDAVPDGADGGGDEADMFLTTITEAFESVDKEGSGYVSAAQLQAVTTNLGESLKDDEVAQLVEFCKQKGWVDDRGRVSYRDWIQNEMGLAGGAD
jgi:calcium-binding protein CML